MSNIEFMAKHANRSFLIPFPPSLKKGRDFKDRKGYRLDVEKGFIHFGLPINLHIWGKFLRYYQTKVDVEAPAYLFSCIWRFQEAAYAETIIGTLHEWAFQSQRETRQVDETHFPPQGVIDYHFTNFILRIISSLDSMACWLNEIYTLGFERETIHYLHRKLADKLEHVDHALARIYADSKDWVDPLNQYRRKISHRTYGLLFPVATEKVPPHGQPLVVVPSHQFGLDLNSLFAQRQREDWVDIRAFCKYHRERLQQLLQTVFDHIYRTREEF